MATSLHVEILWPKVRIRRQHKYPGRRWFCRIERKWADAWVGCFWKAADRPHQLDVWVCIVPFFPIHFGYGGVAYDDDEPF